MTIKEIEQLTGMPRANIRFYESEGLIIPERNENGYREYTEKEVDILTKIKLLRSLQIPLEEIKKLHNGDEELKQTIEEHLKRLNTKTTEINRSRNVCEEIQKAGVNYQMLNAAKYLELLETQDEVDSTEWEKDIVVPIAMPVRRFFARMFDYHLYQCLFYIFLAMVCNKNITMMNGAESLFYTFVVLALMLVLESVQLTVWGTTLGKWLLGITVLNENEQKLTFSDAVYRTVRVLWYGMGLNLPIFNIVRGLKSYATCVNKQILPWDEGIVIERKDKKV